MNKLKELRTVKGLSQSALAEKTGLSLKTLQAYEQGQRNIEKMALITALQLADALEVDVRELLK